jgi:hypothetical protein
LFRFLQKVFMFTCSCQGTLLLTFQKSTTKILVICTNGCNATLGHNLFFDIHKLSARIGNGGSP